MRTEDLIIGEFYGIKNIPKHIFKYVGCEKNRYHFDAHNESAQTVYGDLHITEHIVRQSIVLCITERNSYK